MDKLTIKETKTIINIKQIGQQGVKGDDGDRGLSATVNIGTINTVDYTQPATVENVGTENDAILNFNIPRGMPGDGGAEFSNVGTGQGIWKETINSIAKLRSLLSINSIISIGLDDTEESITFDINTRAFNNAVWDNLSSINEQLTYLQELIETNTNDISAINTAINTINDNITSINNSLSSLNNSVNTNTSAINTINNNITSINNSLSSLTNRITTAETNISNNTNAINTLNSKVLPAGGTAGQVLSKIDGTDYNTQWTNQSSSGCSLDLLENYSFGYVQVYSNAFNTTSSSVFLTNSQQNGYGIDSSIITQSIVEGKELFYYTPKRFYKQATNSYCSYSCGFGDLLVNIAGNGWKVTRKFGLLTANNSQQIFFAGLSSANVFMGAEQAVQSAQALYISIGVGYDSTDTHFNFFFNSNDSIAPIKIPFNGNIIGNLSTSDYTARTIEKVYSVTLEYNPAISSDYIKITFCNLSNGKSGYYNFYFSIMRSFNRNTTRFKTYQALRYAETGSFDTMAFFYDCYRHNLPSIV